MKYFSTVFLIFIIFGMNSCSGNSDKMESKKEEKMTAKKILGNAEYPAICFGGYREKTRNIQPTLEEIREDMLILHRLGFKVIRTYNVYYEEIITILKVIRELKEEFPDFEMYVMLGIWIDCKHAWTEEAPIHHLESEKNSVEVEKAVALAKAYEDIVIVLAVGNEAMVKWAEKYYVEPWVILKWVKHLQDLKQKGELSKDLWITSSDNFASWGGGDSIYHTAELNELIAAVDYLSIHTYPMHDTHYNPSFWFLEEEELLPGKASNIQTIMQRAVDYAASQYQAVKDYCTRLGVEKPIHIGETGWASHSNEHYGAQGSKATDEYKSSLYFTLINQWAASNNVSCFYFEAFDEPWKDANNPEGSENHFGLITVDGKVKAALWDKFDKLKLGELSRGPLKLEKTHRGDEAELIGKALSVDNFVLTR